MQWNFNLKQCFSCAIKNYPIIRLQKKSQENLLVFRFSPHGIFLKFKNKNVSNRREWMSYPERKKLAYLWICARFSKFSRWDLRFNNIEISTFLQHHCRWPAYFLLGSLLNTLTNIYLSSLSNVYKILFNFFSAL